MPLATFAFAQPTRLWIILLHPAATPVALRRSHRLMEATYYPIVTQPVPLDRSPSRLVLAAFLAATEVLYATTAKVVDAAAVFHTEASTGVCLHVTLAADRKMTHVALVH